MAFFAWLVAHFPAKACKSPSRLSISAPIVGQKAGSTQLFDSGVQGIWCDAAYAVLQQTKGLGVSIAQGPHDTDGVPRLQQTQQLTYGQRFLSTH
jgi:hypothetical protein